MSRKAAGESPLTQVRESERYHWLGLVLGCVIGLVAASFHWLGIVVGGALVGLAAATLSRAILSGIGFGLLVVVVWTTLLWHSGSVGQVIAMSDFTLLAVGMALGLSVLGSLVRGVV